MKSTAFMLTALIGIALALQVGFNAVVRTYVGSAVGAALLNFVVGTTVLAIALLVLRLPVPSVGQLAAIPGWALLAGVAGAAYVAGSALFGPLIGGAAFVALIIAGQMVGALALDHYGALGFQARPVTALRLAGAALVVVGVVLLSRE